MAWSAAQAAVWLWVPLALLLSAFSDQVAAAETRVALVIGNTTYEHAPTLANPRHDARAVAAALRRLDFSVQESIDLDMVSMRRALRNFAQELEGADVGLFFYAGHALQVDGQNYLAPVDADLERSSDLIFQAVELNLVLRLLQERPRTSIIFLDACRDNPLTRSLARSFGRARSQTIGQGLADVDSGIGTLIAYATQPDNVALDGKGQHSPFTEALLQHIETPGLEIRQMLSRVRRTVIDTTARQQVPWDHSSLTGDFFFHGAEPPAEKPQPVAAALSAPRPSDDVLVWSVIERSINPVDFELFLQRYPTSPLMPFAESRLAALRPLAAPTISRSQPALQPATTTEAAAQDGPPRTRLKGPLTPGSSAAEPATERVGNLEPPAGPIEERVQTAALPAAERVEREPPRDPPTGEPAPAIRPEPPGQTDRAAPPSTPPRPISVEQARAEESRLGLTRDHWRAVQRSLNALEHPAGPADGVPGRQTRNALKAWQQGVDGNPTGYLTAAQLAWLQKGTGLQLAAGPTAARPLPTLPARADDCDRLAGLPADRDRVGGGVTWEDLDPTRALSACETAIENHPDELRFQLQYGRAQLKAGRLDDARLWLRTAAEKGYAAAQKQIGHLYMVSLGVPADDARAVDWYRKAAEQTDPGAQYILGLMHVLGRGVPQDNMQAITWFRRAAGQGDADAQFMLGWMYQQGRGVRSIAYGDPRPKGN